MSFAMLMIAIWAAAMLAWFLVSKYIKSSDLDRIKARLSGTTKSKKAKGAKPGEASVMQQETTKNRLAQKIVDKYQLAPKIGLFLEQAGMRWAPARLVHTCLLSLAAGSLAGWMLTSSLIIAVALGAVAAGAPVLWIWRKRKSRLFRFEELFPDALEFVSRSMRAGHAFSVSLEMIHREFQEPIAGEFRRTFEEHNLGLPIEIALQKLAKRVPSLDVHFFVSAVLLQKRTGGNLAEILDKLAYVIRERFKLRGRIRAVSAHGRMTAAALSAIPAAVAVLMFYTNPDYVKFFFKDETGNIMLGAAVFLQLVGYLIMKKIVNIEV
ncbi:MAG TPA: type II secretion system F family protein [Bryobacteraceae bacterium]|jgi:tight adherence protein B|nr:type II secretion system F family protein [Bryobacteraceae bacterium]